MTIITTWKLFLISWILESLNHSNIVESAVAAPPWANPKLNPCANQPGGWQLLYWPPDGQCYKIFQMGYPCPDDMELSPSAVGSGTEKELSAECKCPPKTAQSARDGRCYELFTSGPCDKGYYFAPDDSYETNSTSKRQWGSCKQVEKCNNFNEIFWPQTSKCFEKLTRGPCSKGQLLTLDTNKLATCKCNNKQELSDYFYGSKHGCFQHFTRGPCKEKGHLFLPDKTCGCHKFLPHYHEDTDLCFEIGTIGPCNIGEYFQLDSTKQKGTCTCKKGYIRYEENNLCYRPFTQGPCDFGEFLINTTSCINLPCEKSHLYFPENEKCYRIGTQGPCPKNQVVTFDFETRPSVDGLSYNGLCSCEKGAKTNCTSPPAETCDTEANMVFFRNKCYKLYSQGPCARGAWLIPKRRKKELIWSDPDAPISRREGYCDCMPGYTKMIRTSNNRVIAECLSPTVLLADYLNKNFFAYSHTGGDSQT